jgi:hypothetical protein
MPATIAAARATLTMRDWREGCGEPSSTPTVLDGNFSDDEAGRRLRSSGRRGKADEPDEPPTMEVVEEPGPSCSTSRETGTEAVGDLPTTGPELAEAKRPPISNANVFEKIEINFIKAKDTANIFGADPFTDVLPNPCGGSTVSPNPSGGDTLFGHSKEDIGAYKAFVGSFSEGKNCEKLANCHLRSVPGKKLNYCFSFDPVTMSCKSCPGRGEHSLVGGGGGWWKDRFSVFPTRTSLQAFPVPMGSV